ncbi:Fe-S-cluster-containing hydrogenase subunit [Desulfitobacterium dichloroeliminans LMG P-21439]|uniref:Fe-S-cluster-containing hydrogenase subunit n=1 Tax=Desulfitobacterium dichloroeliminans (strain LMG P-21439 / DCA1) TaxID=871963 RepID=L0FCS5_DESDL|nr:4Fe-4S dicluster domain-containing protein [Desulfitobacterium dichloroeliminans]AGA70753.1 Fe-S-cluster-containing hydrogenase subunit [Desulfitobacterium dichloroeliminans LMG P-21439]
MTKLGMTIDQSRCIGCHTCSVACKAQNNVPMGMLWNRVLTEGEVGLDCAQGEFPNLTKNWLPMACQHCENPACLKVCPVGATYKSDDGRVLIDYDMCIGCRYCMAACPYNVRVFNWQDPVRQPDFNYGDATSRPIGVVEKCSMCSERTDQGLEPMCVVVCPAKARKFGDLDDPDSEVSNLIREKNSYQLLPHMGTKPQVYYLK